MKKMFLGLLVLCGSINLLVAQEGIEGFKKENLYTLAGSALVAASIECEATENNKYQHTFQSTGIRLDARAIGLKFLSYLAYDQDQSVTAFNAATSLIPLVVGVKHYGWFPIFSWTKIKRILKEQSCNNIIANALYKVSKELAKNAVGGYIVYQGLRNT